MKIKNIMLIIALVSFAFAASCAKNESQPDIKPKALVPDIMYRQNVNPNDVFSASRNGQSVNIQWQIDFSACKKIQILRNTTGVPRDRDIVADMESSAQSHVDLAPNIGVFWYWMRILPPKGVGKNIGPIRVAPDNSDGKDYVIYTDIYNFSVYRDEARGTINWDIPDKNLKQITFKSNTSAHIKDQKTLLITREWSGKLDDVFQDPQSDYWYWMEVLLDDGTLITRGPTKAEFAGK